MKISQEAKKNGINPRTAYNRIYVLGWNVERAVSTPSTIQRDDKLAADAKNAQLPYSFVKRRLREGWDRERALSTPVGDREFLRRYELRGEMYTMEELEKMSGIPRLILSHRINSLHWTVNRAVVVPLRTRKSRKQSMQ